MTFNLNDKYTSSDGKFVLSGIQAIVKLALLQKEIDEGINIINKSFQEHGSK